MPDDAFEVDVQVHFWAGVQRVSFDRAECWAQDRGEDVPRFGHCTFSVLVEGRPVPEPPPTSLVAAGLLLLAVFARKGLRVAR